MRYRISKCQKVIELRISKLIDRTGFVRRIQKNCFKTKFASRKQPFRGVPLEKRS